jgi:hypothetical protein
MKTEETLEEAAKNFYQPITTNLICSPKLVRDAFIVGAKWQQEQMYSKEEVRQMLWELGDVLFNNNQNGIKEGDPEKYIEEIIQQFKNK